MGSAPLRLCPRPCAHTHTLPSPKGACAGTNVIARVIPSGLPPLIHPSPFPLHRRPGRCQPEAPRRARPAGPDPRRGGPSPARLCRALLGRGKAQLQGASAIPGTGGNQFITPVTRKGPPQIPKQPTNKQKAQTEPGVPVAKLGEQRGCPHGRAGLRLDSPTGFPCRGLPGRSGGHSGPGAALRQGRGRPGAALPPLPSRAEPGRGSRDTAGAESRDGQSCPAARLKGGPAPPAAPATARGHRGPPARHLRGLERRRPLRAANRGCGGREPEAVGAGRSAGSPAEAFQQPAACFHSFPAPVLAPPCPGLAGGLPCPAFRHPAGPARGEAAPAGPGRGAGPRCSRSRAEMRRDASFPLSSHFVALFIFFKQTFSHLWSLPRLLFFPSPCNLLI